MSPAGPDAPVFFRRWTIETFSIAVGSALLGAAWWAASGASIPAWEEWVFRLFNGGPDWLEAPTWPFMQIGSLAIVPIAAVAGFLRWRHWRPAGALLVGPVAGWVLAKVVKELIERGRPADYLSDVILRPAWEGLGFVSGHAAIAFALAVVLTPYLSRVWKVIVWVLAAATGILRMYTAAHLPLDVVGGTGLGIVTGAAALLIFGVPRRP